MSITITCEDCGQRHRLERRVTEPGSIYIVCHSCELPLQAVLESSAGQASPVEPARRFDHATWSSVLDASNPTASA
jgi:hypothetical protein